MSTPATADPREHREPRAGVADRMTRILDVFLAHGDRLLLDEVSRATGLPRSTTFRMLNQLVGLHWLEHTDRGYRLGVRARGVRPSDPDELRSAAAPILNDLHLRTRGVAHLSVLEGRVVRYLDKIGGAASSAMPSRVGARLAPDRTVSGKCLLAHLPAEEVDTLMSIDAGRQRSARQLSRLHLELEQIRGRRGLAIDPAERCGMGITAVAAPIFGSDGPVGSVSVATTNGAPARDMAPLVVVAARRISQAYAGSASTRSRSS